MESELGIEAPGTPPLTRQEVMDGSPCSVELGGRAALTPDIRRDGDFGFIRFQCGPIAEVGINGTTIEALIDVLVTRLERFNAGPFRCRENSLAITHLEEALHWLQARTAKRQAQGVEGTNAPHTS